MEENNVHDDQTNFSEIDQDEISDNDLATPNFAKNTKGTTLILPPSLFPGDKE